jgi:hypothetical protein
MHRVTVDRDRPDFRAFIDLLYGAGRNVDTDGDSDPVNSRTWSYLYIADRESDDPELVIGALEEAPHIFEVKSKSQRLEELSALYLFLYCGVAISDTQPLDEERIHELKAKYSTELGRAESAVWHRSSSKKPYPNVA